MYLLDSHTSNVCKSLPITDIKSYKHVVYIFDAMYYIVSKWPTVHNGTLLHSNHISQVRTI